MLCLAASLHGQALTTRSERVLRDPPGRNQKGLTRLDEKAESA
jgi:hypothetical protein